LRGARSAGSRRRGRRAGAGRRAARVDANGQRFSDESQGYSEQAAIVLAQPQGCAYDIFDERIAVIGNSRTTGKPPKHVAR
jgi:hypothetical protein